MSIKCQWNDDSPTINGRPTESKQQRQLKSKSKHHHIRSNMEVAQTRQWLLVGRRQQLATRCQRAVVDSASTSVSHVCTAWQRSMAPALKMTASWNGACSRRRPKHCTLSMVLPRQCSDHRSGFASLRWWFVVDDEPLHWWLLGAGSVHRSTSHVFGQLDNFDRKIIQDIWFGQQIAYVQNWTQFALLRQWWEFSVWRGQVSWVSRHTQ